MAKVLPPLATKPVCKFKVTKGPFGFVTVKKFELLEVMLDMPPPPLPEGIKASILFTDAVLVGLPSTEVSQISNRSSAVGVTFGYELIIAILC